MSRCIALVLLLISLVLSAQSEFDQFRAVYSISDLYNRKIVNSELLKNIWYLNDTRKTAPIVEVFHDADLLSYSTNLFLANFQAGVAVRISTGWGSSDFWDIAPSRFEIFSLWNCNFLTKITPLTAIVSTILPYYTAEPGNRSIESLNGLTVQFGGGIPIADVSAAFLIASRNGSSFQPIDNGFYFHIKSPRFLAFVEGLSSLDNAASIARPVLFDLLRAGLDASAVNFLFSTSSSILQIVKKARGFIEFDNLHGKTAYCVDVTRMFGVLNAYTKFDFGTLYAAKAGINIFGAFNSDWSTIYQTALDFTCSASFYNFAADPYFAARTDIPTPYLKLPNGMGLAAELTWQAPLWFTLDALMVALDVGMLLISTDYALKSLGNDIDRMAQHIKDGERGGAFSRLTFAVEYNDADTLARFTLAANQLRVRLKISAFY